MKTCGARTRSGTPCRKAAMPNGRCRLHGGKTPSGPDSPHYRHGRYANVFKGQLAEKFSAAQGEEKPLDLLPELQVQRTLLAQYIERVSNKASPGINDLKNISDLVDDVVRTAATIAKVRNETALTIAEIKFIQDGMMRLMEKYVPNPDARRNFIGELRSLIPGRSDAGEEEVETLPAGAEASG